MLPCFWVRCQYGTHGKTPGPIGQPHNNSLLVTNKNYYQQTMYNPSLKEQKAQNTCSTVTSYYRKSSNNNNKAPHTHIRDLTIWIAITACSSTTSCIYIQAAVQHGQYIITSHCRKRNTKQETPHCKSTTQQNKFHYSSRMCFNLAVASSTSSFASLPVAEAKITNKSYADRKYYSSNEWSSIEVTVIAFTCIKKYSRSCYNSIWIILPWTLKNSKNWKANHLLLKSLKPYWWQ